MINERSPMRPGAYIGPDPRFRGKTALVQGDASESIVLVQFDDRSLPQAFGWHPFLRAVFDIEPVPPVFGSLERPDLSGEPMGRYAHLMYLAQAARSPGKDPT